MAKLLRTLSNWEPNKNDRDKRRVRVGAKGAIEMTRFGGRYLFKKTWLVRRLGLHCIKVHIYKDICYIAKNKRWPLNVWAYRVDGKFGGKPGWAIAGHWGNIADVRIEFVR